MAGIPAVLNGGNHYTVQMISQPDSLVQRVIFAGCAENCERIAMSAYHSILSAEKSLGYTCHTPASPCGAVASQNTNLIFLTRLFSSSGVVLEKDMRNADIPDFFYLRIFPH
jgi:hypothetical protein